uniref:Uncharacterized protein n=1 Tax=viral metagenome TaxID=1070528 RepID=A0A6C0J971_9ZZZZ
MLKVLIENFLWKDLFKHKKFQKQLKLSKEYRMIKDTFNGTIITILKQPKSFNSLTILFTNKDKSKYFTLATHKYKGDIKYEICDFGSLYLLAILSFVFVYDEEWYDYKYEYMNMNKLQSL